jgi:hypothetical protein
MTSGVSSESEVTGESIPDAEQNVNPAEKVEPAESVEKVVENIEEPAATPKAALPILKRQALICVGEYPSKILLKGAFLHQKDDVFSIFIDKFSEEISKWSKGSLDVDNISGLDANVETHFWFQVLSYLAQNDDIIARLKNELLENQHGAIIVTSTWDGVGSAMLPTLISRVKEWNTNSVALALLPSRLQPSDAQFNSLSSVGMCASKDSATLLLVDRDELNKYVGVNRNGSVLTGNTFLNYLVELLVSKKTFVQELSELARSFSVKNYTILAATGASLKVYGSLENVLDTTLFRPLLTFDLSTASVLYVLLRMPVHLKDKLARDKIELAIADWFMKKAELKSIYVTEPLYVEDVTDRIDVIMFVGGFDLTEMFASMEKKGNSIKVQAVKKGSIKEEEWRGIVKSLTLG